MRAPIDKKIAIVEDDLDQKLNQGADAIQKGYAVEAYSSRPDAEAGFEQSMPDLAF